MFYRIAISFAATAIGISCFTTDASAGIFGRFGGASAFGRFGGAPIGRVNMTRSYNLTSVRNTPHTFRTGANTSLANVSGRQPNVRTDVNKLPSSAGKAAGGVGTPTAAPSVTGAGTPSGGAASAAGSGGVAARGAYYVPASYSENPPTCGRYPYPPCKKKKNSRDDDDAAGKEAGKEKSGQSGRKS